MCHNTVQKNRERSRVVRNGLVGTSRSVTGVCVCVCVFVCVRDTQSDLSEGGGLFLCGVVVVVVVLGGVLCAGRWLAGLTIN